MPIDHTSHLFPLHCHCRTRHLNVACSPRESCTFYFRMAYCTRILQSYAETFIVNSYNVALHLPLHMRFKLAPRCFQKSSKMFPKLLLCIHFNLAPKYFQNCSPASPTTLLLTIPNIFLTNLLQLVLKPFLNWTMHLFRSCPKVPLKVSSCIYFNLAPKCLPNCSYASTATLLQEYPESSPRINFHPAL